jgi:threonine dehydrogenase-like Zn-dependent dehydrogenase
MIALPDDGDLSEWVMCQPSGTVLYSCQRMGNVLGQNVAIVGQGGIGLSFTMLAAMMGARRVIGIDLLDYRLEWAKSFGATHTINPGQQEVVQAIQDITGGEGADVVVEAAGFPDAFNLCFRLVRQLGTVVLFGIQASDTIPLEHDMMMAKQPTIVPTVGARTPNVTAHIERMVELKTRGLVDPGRMVTHRIGFDDLQQAYDMYTDQQDEVVKVVMSL